MQTTEEEINMPFKDKLKALRIHQNYYPNADSCIEEVPGLAKISDALNKTYGKATCADNAVAKPHKDGIFCHVFSINSPSLISVDKADIAAYVNEPEHKQKDSEQRYNYILRTETRSEIAIQKRKSKQRGNEYKNKHR